MKQILTALLLALTFNSQAMAQQKTIKIRVVETSDVHGCFFPYDFINRKPKAGSLARVSSYVDSLRQEYNTTLTVTSANGKSQTVVVTVRKGAGNNGWL